MRIVSTGMEWVGRDPGGLNRYFADLTDTLAERGHEVKGYVTAEGESYETPAYIRDVMAGRRPGGTIGRLRAFRRDVAEALEQGGVDVFNPHFALYAFPIARSSVPEHVPIVTHFHGPWADETKAEQDGQARGLKHRMVVRVKKRLEAAAYRRSDAFIVLSHYFKDVLTADYDVDPSRIHIVPGAADTLRFSPAMDRKAVRRRLGLAGDAPVLFTARRLARRMGLDRLIEAMREVRDARPDVRLYIAGEGQIREELERQINELGLAGTVQLLGKIPGDDLVRWYQAADLVVMPTVQLEGFGLVTVEALACGTPVVGTPYGGTKEILEPFAGQLLFADATPAAIARKLASILSGETVLPTREACRDYILSHYTWPKAAARVEQVFEQAVRERKDALRHEKNRLL